MLEKISIVMMEPQHPGNIGSVARAMKTMDLKNLVLVAPRRYPDPQALWRSANATDILEKAVVLETLEEALRKFNLLWAPVRVCGSFHQKFWSQDRWGRN